MPFLMSDYAEGAKAAAIPDLTIAELAKKRADTGLVQAQTGTLNQQNQARAFEIEDLNRLSSMYGGASTPQTEQPLGIPSLATPDLSQEPIVQEVQKVHNANSKIKTAESKVQQYQKLFDSIKYDPQLSTMYQHKLKVAQSELESLQQQQQQMIADTTKKAVGSLLGATDQTTYDRARNEIAKNFGLMAYQSAINQGTPEEQARALGKAESDARLKQLPSTYGASAKHAITQINAEMGGLDSMVKLNKEFRDQKDQTLQEEKAKLEKQELSEKITKLKAETDKINNPKKPEKDVANDIKELRQLVNTQSLELNRMTDDEEQMAKARLEQAKDAMEGLVDKWTVSEEEKAELKAAQDSYDSILKRKQDAQLILNNAQQKLKLLLGIAEEKGIDVSGEEKPKTSNQYKTIISTYKSTVPNMTEEAILLDINSQQPSWSPEQVLQAAIQKGYLINKERK